MSKTKNNRLDEGQVRRFMGLANITPLGEGFLDRIREEDDLPPEEGGEDMPPMPPADDAGLPGEEALPGDEAAPPTEDAAAGATEMAQDVADAVADALTAALGQHGVEVTAGDAGGEEPALPAEEPALDDELPPAPEEGGEELPPEEELEELESAGIEVVNDDKLVQEVARRVAARLMKESKSRS